MVLAHAQLAAVSKSLQDMRVDTITPHVLSELARQQSALLDELPDRYREVLPQLLDRLESSALFSEESCSFSQKNLLDNLQVWVEKAHLQLLTR